MFKVLFAQALKESENLTGLCFFDKILKSVILYAQFYLKSVDFGIHKYLKSVKKADMFYQTNASFLKRIK